MAEKSWRQTKHLKPDPGNRDGKTPVLVEHMTM
jgi:hypothetical protein